MAFYSNLAEFYREDLNGRKWSQEADYGVHWRLEPWPFRWRVSYVRNMGEVYVIHQQRQGETYVPVIVLGHVEPDPVANERLERYYQTMNQVLEGHREVCLNGERNNLLWVQGRLAEYMVSLL